MRLGGSRASAQSIGRAQAGDALCLPPAIAVGVNEQNRQGWGLLAGPGAAPRLLHLAQRHLCSSGDLTVLQGKGP